MRSTPSAPSRVLAICALAMVVTAAVLVVIANTTTLSDPRLTADPKPGSTARAGAAPSTRRTVTVTMAASRTFGAARSPLTSRAPTTLTGKTRPITDTSVAAGSGISETGSGGGGVAGRPMEPVTDAVTALEPASGASGAEPRPTGVTSGNGSVIPLTVSPPLFSLARPFDDRHDNRASRYYPYGTNANGTLLLHHGVDIGNPMGAEVLAIGDGKVVYAGSDRVEAYGPQTSFYGNVIVIQQVDRLDGRPLYSLYGHLSRIDVAMGQPVGRGQQIGLVGSTGIALGPHLHLEIRLDAKDYESTLNSELFMTPLPGHGTIVGRLEDPDDKPLAKRSIGLFQAGPKLTETWVAETRSYPGLHVNSLPALGENFVFADTEVGDYVIHADLGRRARSTARVHVADGEVVFVTLAP